MGDLSKNFSRHEMACKCGCGFDTIDAKTLEIAEAAREFVNEPITPSNAARCEIHNKNVGGAPNSWHLYGRAIDLPCSNPMALYEFLCSKYPGKYGFIRYPGFVHIDSRGEYYRNIK